MKHVVTSHQALIGQWIMEQTDGEWVPGKGFSIGLINDSGKILAGTYYESFNGKSILMHCAGLGKTWLNREFLWFSFFYPFEQLGAEKIISPVESSNSVCIRFIKHLGFNIEATLKDASPKGDILLFTLSKSDCKWLSLKRDSHGQAESASTG